MRIRRTLKGSPYWASAVIAGVLVGSGCSGSSTAPDPGFPAATFSVDASGDAVYVRLGDPATAVSVSDAATSAAWDLGFQQLSVVVNGGESGPGGVEVHCVCQNSSATDAQVMEMTSASELGDFEAVTSAAIPDSPGAWSSTGLDEAPWYRYFLSGPGAHHVWPTYEVYLIRRGSTVYKVQFIGYYGPAGESRQITFRYGRLQ